MKYQELRENLKESMRAKDEVRTSVIRGILSGLTNELVAKGKKPTEEPTEEEMLAVIKRQAKQREDSIEQFEKGNRPDLAEKEKSELEILKAYLPQMMSREEIEKIARAKKEEMGAADKSKMGVLIGAVMKECKGAADGKDVKEVVESLFV